MKKKSSQSAFFNPRLLIGLFVVLAGVFLALLGFGAFSNLFAQTKSTKAAANMSQLSPLSRQAARAQAVPASSAPGALAGKYTKGKPDTSLLANDRSQQVVSAAPSHVTGGWTLGTQYPSTDVRYGFAQTATHFYVFGGVDNGTRTNAVNRMDIATGFWQPRAPMPFTSEAPTCALMESTGIAYCAEGDTGSGFASYNTATDTWTSLASIPGGDHYGSASGAFNGKVFVAGGSTGFSNAVQVYDVATNTWSAGTPAPNGYLLAGYQQVGQYLYVVGGWTGGAPTGLTTTTRLDMSSAPGVWEQWPGVHHGQGRLRPCLRCRNQQVVCAGWGSEQ